LVYGLHTSLDQQSYSTSGAVSTWMGDHLQAGKPSWYVTSDQDQLSLAILHGHAQWVPAKTGEQTITLHDALALYPWSHSVRWRLVEG